LVKGEARATGEKRSEKGKRVSERRLGDSRLAERHVR
jgi:hypothetical protein